MTILVFACCGPRAETTCDDSEDNDDDGLVDCNDGDCRLDPACLGTGGSTDADGDGYDAEAAGGDDCDDENASVYPGADEICDDLDNDCDGSKDEDANDAAIWYADHDGDGYGDPSNTSLACEAPSGFVANGQDCDDEEPTAWPGATEDYEDGADNDCDGYTDEVEFPAAYDRLILAVLTADSGSGIVEVAAGTHTMNESISVDNRVQIIAPAGPEATIFDGGGSGPIIEVEASNGTLLLQGITFTGGHNTNSSGGAILAESTADITIEGCLFTGNSSDFSGGAIDVRGGGYQSMHLKVSNCRFEDNTCNYDGGALRIGSNTVALVEQSVFAGNSAAGDAGAVMVESALDLSNALFVGNQADWAGSINSWNGVLIATNITVVDSYSSTSGGCVVARNAVLDSVVFAGCEAGGEGAALYGEDNTLRYSVVPAEALSGSITQESCYDDTPVFLSYDSASVWSDNDFHLSSTSAGYDGGNPDNTRNDTDGSRNNSGAFGGPGGDWTTL